MALEADRSLMEVLGDIVGNLQQIVRGEVRLAQAEMRDAIGKAKRGVIFLVAGGAMGELAMGVLLLACIYALATVMVPWMAALVVAIVVAVASAICINTGVKQIGRVTLPPPRTVASVQETVQWAKTRAK